jgi:hypothetical protein
MAFDPLMYITNNPKLGRGFYEYDSLMKILVMY